MNAECRNEIANQVNRVLTLLPPRSKPGPFDREDPGVKALYLFQFGLMFNSVKTTVERSISHCQERE